MMTAATEAPTTVLYLLDYTDFGGGETAFLAMMQAMQRERTDWKTAWQPIVVLPGEGPVASALRENGLIVRVTPFPRRLRLGPIPWFSFTAAHALKKLIDEFQPALIHAHNFFGLLYGGRAAMQHGLPVVWTCHGWFDLDTAAKRRIAKRYATRIVCVSDAVREEAIKFLPVERVGTDYLGIEPFETAQPPSRSVANELLRHQVRDELSVDRSEPVIAVVARFQPIKGHVLLLDALPKVFAALPGLRVWLIGAALEGHAEEAAHKRNIEARVRREGWESSIRFLGARRDARRLMRAADLIVIPSARESFSMVAVEALEAGVPVVGPDGWGPREIIDSPATGLRFLPGDTDSLAAAMLALMRREGTGAAFDAEAGPRRVRQMFSAEAHWQRTKSIYQGLLKPSPLST